MNKTILIFRLAQLIVILLAITVIEFFMIGEKRQPIKHKQFIVGPRAPGQIPDSSATDSNDNTIYYFKPITND